MFCRTRSRVASTCPDEGGRTMGIRRSVLVALAAVVGAAPLAVAVAGAPAAMADPCSTSAPAVGIAPTAAGQGFYVVSNDGCVGTAGDAVNAGAPPASLNAPIVG